MMNELNKRHRLFALGVISGKSNTQAAKDAGYAARSAHTAAYRLMKRADVLAYIAANAAKVADVVKLDAAYVLDGLMDNAQSARDQERPDYNASTRAFELLGRYLKLFVDRSEITLSGDAKAFLDKVVDIIDEEVTDPDTRERIIQRLVKADAG